MLMKPDDDETASRMSIDYDGVFRRQHVMMTNFHKRKEGSHRHNPTEYECVCLYVRVFMKLYKPICNSVIF